MSRLAGVVGLEHRLEPARTFAGEANMTSLPLAATVVVCTNRRWEYALVCLDSLLSQVIPGGSFEVLVVDNAPVRREPPEYSRRGAVDVRWLHEGEAGLSHARNLGAREARAGLVAYIDDDATAGPQWLANLLQPFSVDDGIAVVGGAIRVSVPGDLPWWYDASLEGWFSRFDVPSGGVRRVEGFGSLPYGANLAIRKSAWEELGGFDTALGRRGADLAGGEDLEFSLKAMVAGYAVCTVPDAAVLHHISADRIRLCGLWHVAREAGLSLSRLDSESSRRGWLREAAVLFMKSLCPLPSIGVGRRLNFFLRSRLYLTAALHRGRRRARLAESSRSTRGLP